MANVSFGKGTLALTGSTSSFVDGMFYYNKAANDLYLNDSGTVYNTGLGGIYTTTGTYSAFTVSIPGISSLTTGLTIKLRFHTYASTTATLNVNSLGAKSIYRCSSIGNSSLSELGSYTIYTNSVVTLTYNGTYWVVQDRSKPSGSDIYGNIPFSKISGFGVSLADYLPAHNATNADNTWYNLFGQGNYSASDVYEYYGNFDDYTSDMCDYDLTNVKVITIAFNAYYLSYYANNESQLPMMPGVTQVCVVKCYKQDDGSWVGCTTAPPNGTSSSGGIALNQYKISLAHDMNTVYVYAYSSGTGDFTEASTKYDSGSNISCDYTYNVGTENVMLEKYIWVLSLNYDWI